MGQRSNVTDHIANVVRQHINVVWHITNMVRHIAMLTGHIGNVTRQHVIGGKRLSFFVRTQSSFDTRHLSIQEEQSRQRPQKFT